MKKLSLFVLAVCMMSCSKDASNFTLKGNVKGLMKGTVYLQKIEDSTLITIDSMVINGTPTFELQTDLDSPEILYLKLNKHDNEDNVISFFADKGVTEIISTNKNFLFDAKIKGSKQQEKLEEYLVMMSRFQGQNLDLIKDNFDAQKDQDSTKLNASIKNYDNLVKRKYLYTVNFAINNKDSEVAPYLALTQIYDANIKYLDTINSSLLPAIKSSKYGKELQAFITKRKTE